MKLLIDADYIVYKNCASAEYDIDWGDDVIMVGSSFKKLMEIVIESWIRLHQSTLILT